MKTLISRKFILRATEQGYDMSTSMVSALKPEEACIKEMVEMQRQQALRGVPTRIFTESTYREPYEQPRARRDAR